MYIRRNHRLRSLILTPCIARWQIGWTKKIKEECDWEKKTREKRKKVSKQVKKSLVTAYWCIKVWEKWKGKLSLLSNNTWYCAFFCWYLGCWTFLFPFSGIDLGILWFLLIMWPNSFSDPSEYCGVTVYPIFKESKAEPIFKKKCSLVESLTINTDQWTSSHVLLYLGTIPEFQPIRGMLNNKYWKYSNKYSKENLHKWVL